MKAKRAIVLGVLFFSPPVLYGSEQAGGARIKRVRGDVAVQAEEGETWKPARTAAPLRGGDTLRTRSASSADVEFDIINAFRLKESSLLKVEDLAEAAGKGGERVERIVSLRLMEGEVLANLKKLPKDTRFHVLSPVAIAGASGTAFSVSVAPDGGKTRVAVLDGGVRVESAGEPHKAVTAMRFQEVRVAPWSIALYAARGTALLAEKFRKEGAAPDAEGVLRATGSGADLPKARLAALTELSRMVRGIHVEEETTVDDLMEKDPDLSKRLFEYIAAAKQTTADGKVTAEIAVRPLYAILGRAAGPPRGVISAVSRADYSSRFGALARVTTERAAKVLAYRKLAERVKGTVLDSKTTLQDFVVESDVVRTTLEATIRALRPRGYVYYSDGSVTSLVEMGGKKLVESLSGKDPKLDFGTHYLSSPEVIEVGDFQDFLKLSEI